MSAGYSHSLVVRSDGTVWAMGSNDSGQVGDGGTTREASKPICSLLY
ncbi:RCC1 domain-containing protein [Stigmatella sp. ncwal1]|uniref:RCC1 domain-containing protein n=1 Tax=Stigmatella ashevillensis TaxID=2995309 RepID=A0ABT5DBM1_9BACT|nr:RCC1 domain-containing protein [Stigmatella ashevillena]MDC0711004.1 RCC1 domain-containing protein [Stigmatella ashevillena]